MENDWVGADLDAETMEKVDKLANDLIGIYGYAPSKDAIIKALTWDSKFIIEMVRETIERLAQETKGGGG